MAEENPSAPVEQPSKPEAGEASNKTKVQDSVSYDTHRKLLAEKKSMQERLQNTESELNEIKSQIAAKTQQDLEEQNRFKELYEGLKTENETLKTSIHERDVAMQDALKIDAFNKALGDGRKIDRKYRSFIDTKNIMLDTQTGAVDELSASKEVERVLAEFPEIVKSSGTSRALPNQAPTGVSSVKKPTQQERMQILANYLDAKRKG